MKDAHIIFFEPPTSKVFQRRKVRVIKKRIHVHTLPHIFEMEEWNRRGFAHNYGKLAKTIQRAADHHRMHSPVLWCTAPWQVHLLPYLSVQGVVYDCYQSWNEYPREWEENLATEADVIFTASPELGSHLAEFNHNIVHLPNGVDGDIFQLEEEVAFSRPTQRQVPVLGYTGHLWPDLDLGPVERLAMEHPKWRIVLLGEDYGNPWVEVLEDYPNVRFMGCRPPEEVAFYMNRFDICLHLLCRSDQGCETLPTRFFEYLTSGNPIVSMLFEDQVEPYPDVVYGAHTYEEFVQLCEHALHEVGSWARARRIAYGQESHWDRRAEGMLQILQTIGFYQ